MWTLPWADFMEKARQPIPISFRRSRLSPEMARAAVPWKTINQIQAVKNRSKKGGEPVRMVVLGDAGPARFWFARFLWPTSRVYETLLGHVRREMGRRNIDFSMQLGDQMKVGKIKEYKKLLALLAERVAWPFLTVLGNHDRSAPHAGGTNKLYRAVFGEPDYFFDYAGVRFVVLDTSLGSLSPKQLNWLDSVLQTDLRKIVFTHEPPGVFKQWTRFLFFNGGGFRRGSLEFVEIMARYNVDRVYMGHVHRFGFKEYKGVRYVLSGSAGSPLYPVPAVREKKFFNYLLVEISSQGIRETVCKLDGTSFSLPPT
ncbi:MAG: metallophosphoesterase [Elusimicrobia bacterium]|nr:metallophosphoesterase [Elusimicrobiota bacterium]